MAKTENDKYYTRQPEVDRVMQIVRKYIPLDEVKEIIEPSAGDGAFCKDIIKLATELGATYRFFDLFIDDVDTPYKIERMDFRNLEKEIGYKRGRLFIGNPPFGNGSSLYKLFRDGSMRMGDWAVYIGPASLWNVYWGLKGMHLVYTELLGNVEYRGPQQLKVNTAINVYKRIEPEEEEDFFFDAKKTLENDVLIDKYTRDTPSDADFFLVYMTSSKKNFGTLDPERKFSQHIGIKVNNKEKFEEIKEFCETFNKKYVDEIFNKAIGAPRLQQDFVRRKMLEELYPSGIENMDKDMKVLGIKRRGPIVKEPIIYKNVELF